ncbi:hypothetical protein HN630_00135 [archaeon]|jgi:hypothetical protein|nr:hypothetical protein [archaeon]
MRSKTVSGEDAVNIIITAVKEIKTKDHPYWMEELGNSIADFHFESLLASTGKDEFQLTQ